MRIDALTAEQEARFAEYRDRWTEIGLCTEPANRARAERGIALAYRRGGIVPPSRIVWCGSPLSQGITRAVVQGVGDSVWASVRASVGASGYGQHDAGWLSFYRYSHDVLGLTDQTAALGGLWEIAESAGW